MAKLYYAKKTTKENTTENSAEPKTEAISKKDLITALDNVECDKFVVIDMIYEHPEMVKLLTDAKDKEGKPMFDALNVDLILFNCKDTIEKNPNRIKAILQDSEAIDIISSHENRGVVLGFLSRDMLSSTEEIEKQLNNPSNLAEERETQLNDSSNTNKLADIRRRLAQHKYQR